MEGNLVNPKANLIFIPKNDNKSLYEVIKPIFIELAVALTVNIVTITFFAAPLSVTLITVAALFPGLIRCCHTAYAILKNGIEAEQVDKKKLRTIQLFSRLALADTIGLAFPNLLIHECGHAFAANLLFKNARVRIWVASFKGGATHFTISNGLTTIGSLLGRRCSLLVIAAAGIVATSAFCIVEMLAATKLVEQRPVMAEYMNLHAISNLFHEVMYCFSAFLATEKDLSHDLVNLWYTGGIHPLIPITAMIALPILCGGYRFISSGLQTAA